MLYIYIYIYIYIYSKIFQRYSFNYLLICGVQMRDYKPIRGSFILGRRDGSIRDTRTFQHSHICPQIHFAFLQKSTFHELFIGSLTKKCIFSRSSVSGFLGDELLTRKFTFSRSCVLGFLGDESLTKNCTFVKCI